jgi:hypothetical protein
MACENVFIVRAFRATYFFTAESRAPPFSTAVRDMNEGAMMRGHEALNEQHVEQLRSIPIVPEILVNPDPDGQMFFRLLLIRKQQKKLPEWESLVKLYEKTGYPMHYLAMVHMILDTVVLRRGLTYLIPRPEN